MALVFDEVAKCIIDIIVCEGGNKDTLRYRGSEIKLTAAMFDLY